MKKNIRKRASPRGTRNNPRKHRKIKQIGGDALQNSDASDSASQSDLPKLTTHAKSPHEKGDIHVTPTNAQ